MSRQLYMYALPTDIQMIVAELKERLSVMMICATSPTPKPTWIDSPIRNDSLLPSSEATSTNCCLVSGASAKIEFKYYEKQSIWHVTDDSEVIAVSGCDFDGRILVRGRFYCQTDMLKGNEIVPKSSEFVRWADRVYRLTRKRLNRSQELDAYVGRDALIWKQQGGRFVSLALPGHGLVPAPPGSGIERF